jgi:polygalacturonase
VVVMLLVDQIEVLAIEIEVNGRVKDGADSFIGAGCSNVMITGRSFESGQSKHSIYLDSDSKLVSFNKYEQAMPPEARG